LLDGSVDTFSIAVAYVWTGHAGDGDLSQLSRQSEG
jgi:hypothetical protein